MTHSGGLSFLSTEGEQTIGTGGTFERLFEGNMAYTGVHLDDFTESDGRLTYTGSVLKHFDISAYMSIESGEVAQRIEIRIAQGGTTIEAERGEFIMSRNAVDAIGVENLNRMNQGGGGSINVNFSGNVMSRDFIEQEAIPQIKEAIRRGADIGVS